ncbi:MAG: TetR family transcriptional regulator [Acidobacteria bacterium]|nr:TetR family transcriptional regulator [Acidobacteriota bacterium]
MVRRDPEGSRRRILEAAVVEFAANGLAGARLDAITTRAGVSKQLAVYYFGTKERLFRAAIWAKLEEHRIDLEQRFQLDYLSVSDEIFRTDLELVRLLMWEALEVPDAGGVENERSAMYAGWVERIRDEQAAGLIDSSFAPEQVVLLCLAEGLFPSAFPQLAQLVTGKDNRSRSFRAQRAEFIETLQSTLRPGAR